MTKRETEAAVTVALCDAAVPFVTGGAERLREGLCSALLAAGFETEIVTVPFRWYPPAHLLRGMALWRLVDVAEAAGRRIDRAIALRFPAYLVRHPDLTVWLMHQHRTAHELWEHPLGDLHHYPEGPSTRCVIQQVDRHALSAVRRIYAISKTVARRLAASCGVEAAVLYPPLSHAASLRVGDCGDYVLFAGRLDRLKRPQLLLHALAAMRQPLRAVICGRGAEEEPLRRLAAELGLGERVRFAGHVPDDELFALLAGARAVFYAPVDEDYGYLTLEAHLSGKPVVTAPDSGGTLEFVVDGHSGIVADAEPAAMAAALDALAASPEWAIELGARGRRDAVALDLSWPKVVAALTS